MPAESYGLVPCQPDGSSGASQSSLGLQFAQS